MTEASPVSGREPGVRGTVKMLLELVKFEHSVFALPYAFIGALYGAWSTVGVLIAATTADRAPHPSLYRLVHVMQDSNHTVLALPTWEAIGWITLAMVGARAFAFVVNRAVDREIDARNPRTAGRAVPAGLVEAWELWLFAAAMLGVYALAISRLHPITWWLSPIPVAVFIAYPYFKRFTWLCHYWLGIALGLAPIGGWAAVTGDVLDWRPWALGLAVAVWTAGFDIIYATQDIESDRAHGVHSIPADKGLAWGLRQTRWLHALTIALLLAAGQGVGAEWPYLTGIAVAAVLLAYENAIVRPDDLSRVNAAFFTVNGIIAIVVFIGSLADLLLRSGR